MKILIQNGDYTFTAAAGTISLDNYVTIDIENVLLVTNVVDNIIIYNFADPAKGGTVATNTLTLTFDTSAMSDTDELQIFYEDPNASSGGGTEYTEGDTDASITGTAILWEDGGNTLRPVSAATPLPVNVVSGNVQYNEGDVDGTITGVAVMMEDAGNTLEPLQGSLADGLLVNLGANNDVTVAGVSTLAEQQTQTTHLATIAGDTTDIEAAVELIDDTVATLGTTTYSETTTKGLVVGAIRRDADTSAVNTDNEIAPLQVDALGRLKVEIFDGGDSHTVDGTITANAGTGTFIVGDAGAIINLDGSGDVQVDVLTLPATPTGDNTIGRVKITDGTDVADVLDLTNSNPLTVAIVDGSGDQITSFGGGTQYTEDAAAAANPIGNATILVRQDTPATLVDTDGDNVAQRGTNYGAAYTQIVTSAGAFVDTFGGGTQYTEGDTDATITGNASLMEVAGNELRPIQGTVADGLLVNLGTNNDVTVTGSVTANAGTNLNTSALALEATLQSVKTAVELIDNTVSGSELQVDIVTSALPTGASTLAEQQSQTTHLATIAGDTTDIEAAVELLDDTVYTDDTSTHSTGSSKGLLMMAAATPSDASVDANDVGALAMTTDRRLQVAPLGFFVTCSTDVTRPADTTAYSTNDALSDSTSAPTSGGFTFTGAARVSGGAGIITDAIITTSNDPATTLVGEIWMFNTSVTNINDNSPWVVSDSEIKTCVGKIPFTLEDAGNNGFYHAQNLSIGFTCSGSANLRFLVKVKNAYTPASAEVLTFVLKIIQID